MGHALSRHDPLSWYLQSSSFPLCEKTKEKKRLIIHRWAKETAKRGRVNAALKNKLTEGVAADGAIDIQQTNQAIVGPGFLASMRFRRIRLARLPTPLKGMYML